MNPFRSLELMRLKLGELKMTASAFGIYAGLLGMEHGYFETLQGNVRPTSTRIMAVHPSELPFPFGHEPAITIVPNFLLTGSLAMIVGLFIITWSAAFIPKKGGALVLLLLSVTLFLVGGGFGPMSLLIPASIAVAGTNHPQTRWGTHLSTKGQQFLAWLWLWCFIAALLYVPGEFALGYILGVKNDPYLNLVLCYPLVGLFVLTLVAGFACDGTNHELCK